MPDRRYPQKRRRLEKRTKHGKQHTLSGPRHITTSHDIVFPHHRKQSHTRNRKSRSARGTEWNRDGLDGRCVCTNRERTRCDRRVAAYSWKGNLGEPGEIKNHGSGRQSRVWGNKRVVCPNMLACLAKRSGQHCLYLLADLVLAISVWESLMAWTCAGMAGPAEELQIAYCAGIRGIARVSLVVYVSPDNKRQAK